MHHHQMYGLETEYGFFVRVSRESELMSYYFVDLCLKQLLEEVSDLKALASVWLLNGGRFYIDVGNHPEYSTPECISPYQLVVAHAAGDEIIRRAVESVREDFVRENPDEDISIFVMKDNRAGSHFSRERISYGCHENYLLELTNGITECDIAYLLGPFFATRYIWDGNGCLRKNTETELLEFIMSQRADFMHEYFGNDSTQYRAMVAMRTDHHVNNENRFRRLHIISGDSHRLQFSVWLRAAVTGLLIKIAEEEMLPELKKEYSCPHDIIRKINRDFSFSKNLLETRIGTMSSLEVQRWYYDLAFRYADLHPKKITKEEKRALKEWGRILYYLTRDPYSLVGTVEWITKKAYLDKIAERRGINLSSLEDKKLKMYFIWLDIEYHNLASGSIYDKMLGYGLREIVPQALLVKALKKPPPGSRAIWRSKFISRLMLEDEYSDIYKQTYIDWAYVEIGREKERKLRWSFPSFDCVETQPMPDVKKI